ncbi:hypothetical protein EK21DRAFT_117582 [Setomelanomma holmii]|uniref:Uncharacterized protein n=1 Tax=Setomelanomma holmii TaxID=210430 RepID=A0A9P4GZU0_9PLEO|nr:hypothetical protein EK21DRAFT_117582 [Setomelanomma holmii]
MQQIARRKPMKNKGRNPPPRKTLRRERRAVERAFIAGACIAGSLSHNDCAQLFGPNVASESTITRTVQRVNERAMELNTTIIYPCCFEFPSNRGPARLLDDEQRARVVAITIASQQSREKESWQVIKDGDFVNARVPNSSVSLHENIMYDAGYARRGLGWKPTLSPEQKKERYEWALAHNPDKDEYSDGLRDFRYDHKDPCYTYFEETDAEKRLAEEALVKENAQRKRDDNILQGNLQYSQEAICALLA